jgi:hypothetical protein
MYPGVVLQLLSPVRKIPAGGLYSCRRTTDQLAVIDRYGLTFPRHGEQQVWSAGPAPGQVRFSRARGRAQMTGPGWLAAVFAGVMLVIAACCAIRLGFWRLRGRTADPQADALHVLMGIAMAGMLEPRIAPVPDSVWLGVFASAAAWFGWQATRARSRRCTRASCAHPAPHAVECAAMLYMLLPARPAMTMPSMGGPGTSPNPALTVVLALFMLGYVVWTADQLATLSRTRTLTTAGQHGDDGVLALAPRFAACYKIAMSVAMGYMLLAMV